ncbi:hypothetical protein BM613_11325 [Sulfoacidibacillus thermotolerans]|uniref:Uracil-DNA glycosylase-like domain-containing protein n=1 Tax=Sulfoacidibacillus thermotolerans TaxID=1765684 RepID=A0A2U3D6L3_SULT2|nr:hypothetical protein BM613_11325 [Sulfoacidibacillus thermotolerans]
MHPHGSTNELLLLQSQFDELTTSYYVPDFISSHASFIFLLESPHLQELKHGAPVSGSSGLSMSKHLFGEKYSHIPLGIMVKKNMTEQLDRPSLNVLGVMNVCQIPMQASAYQGFPKAAEFRELFSLLENLRTANQRDHFSDAKLQALQNLIAQKLQEKLYNLIDRRCYIIPCGRFAQKFFRIANITSPNWTVLLDIPHPSYNNWSKPQYQSAINEMIRAFAQMRSHTPSVQL